jgi:hypothetical protein
LLFDDFYGIIITANQVIYADYLVYVGEMRELQTPLLDDGTQKVASLLTLIFYK